MYSPLDRAGIDQLDAQVARELFPQTRVFLRDLLAAERLEDDRAAHQPGDPDGPLTITADDLRAAQRQLEQMQAPAGQPTGPAPSAALNAPAPAPAPAPVEGANRTLHICIGPRSPLLLDVPPLVALRTATGLDFHRLLAPTPVALTELLRRERNLHHPVQLLHLDLRASAAGVEFSTGPVDAGWLAAHLAGVHIMLLSSWAGAPLNPVDAPWLRSVPHVVAVREDLADEDAAVFSRRFWHNIGLGQPPAPALAEALTHIPPELHSHITAHWPPAASVG